VGVVEYWYEILLFLQAGRLFDFYKYWVNRLKSKEQCEHHDIEQRVNDFEAAQGKKLESLFITMILYSDKGED
jgi:hypothetical protein